MSYEKRAKGVISLFGSVQERKEELEKGERERVLFLKGVRDLSARVQLEIAWNECYGH